jgi:hypothetical protein
LQVLFAHHLFHEFRQRRLFGFADEISNRAFEGITPAHGTPFPRLPAPRPRAFLMPDVAQTF